MRDTLKKLAKAILAALAAITLLFTMTACAPSAKIDITKVTSIIDVRTPTEFAGGHLQGAVNIDVEGADFVATVSKLDRVGNYVLYCHSGRRAGIALDAMKTLGFSKLTNAGGIDAAASATGLKIVK